MRAVRCHEYGPPERLPELLRVEEVPEEAPGPGQARVEVHAAAVNFPDVLILANRYQLSAPLPITPGSEFAGVVREVGEGVSGLTPGDRVFGAVFVGAFAEQVVAHAAGLGAVPEDVGFEAAAAFGVAYGTAWPALVDAGGLTKGDTLLVLGAAGGVGLAAVEIGHRLGARVIAAASTAEKRAACRAAGADETVDSSDEDLRARLKEVCGRAGVDVVLDPVGGAVSEPALRSLGYGGRFVVVGFASGEIPRIPLNLALLKSARIVGFEIGSFMRHEPEAGARGRALLLAMLARGELSPRVDTVYPLERAAAALAHVSERRAIGKVVVRVR